jgi:hypothetical protein
MKTYELHFFFFVRDRKVYTNDEFRKDTAYHQILSEIDRFIFPQITPDPGKLKDMIEVRDKTETLNSHTP